MPPSARIDAAVARIRAGRRLTERETLDAIAHALRRLNHDLHVIRKTPMHPETIRAANDVLDFALYVMAVVTRK